MHQPHHSSSRAWRSNLYESDCSSSATSFNALGSPTAEVAPSYPVSYDAHGGASNGKGLLNTGRPGVIKETVFSSEVHSIEYTDPKLQQQQSDPAISAQTNHLTQDSSPTQLSLPRPTI